MPMFLRTGTWSLIAFGNTGQIGICKGEFGPCGDIGPTLLNTLREIEQM